MNETPFDRFENDDELAAAEALDGYLNARAAGRPAADNNVAGLSAAEARLSDDLFELAHTTHPDHATNGHDDRPPTEGHDGHDNRPSPTSRTNANTWEASLSADMARTIGKKRCCTRGEQRVQVPDRVRRLP